MVLQHVKMFSFHSITPTLYAWHNVTLSLKWSAVPRAHTRTLWLSTLNVMEKKPFPSFVANCSDDENKSFFFPSRNSIIAHGRSGVKRERFSLHKLLQPLPPLRCKLFLKQRSLDKLDDKLREKKTKCACRSNVARDNRILSGCLHVSVLTEHFAISKLPY